MLLGFSQIGKLAEELVEAYSLRAVTILNIVVQAYELMDDMKQGWDTAYQELKESLASNSSLRRKDFELLMRHLVDLQQQRQQWLKSRLRHFSDAQVEITMALKDALRAANSHRVSELKDDAQAALDDLRNNLVVFQREQAALTAKLKLLAAKGSALTIKELKDVVNN